ncbi:hypothetical protein ACK3SF_01180 [Candidatus Nanosalina sp. VS9-1]|uniref:hypothetical protein n=1 Tax=Candidatus Nanosalina sp. VS9-1 TaxID=3388566 RepID=UPI0039E1D2E7
MREVQKYRYIFAAVLTITIFTLGVLFSNFVDDTRYNSLQNEIQQDNVELESKQLQLNYIRSGNVDSCQGLEAGLQDIVANYNNRLGNLQDYEENSFFRSDDFESMKNLYVLSGLRYWMFADELQDKCDYNVDTVLYFTTQIGDADECDACGYTGEQLSFLKQKYGDQLLVFTVPTELEDGMIDILERQYNITEVPTVIVNENASNRLEGRVSSDEIEKFVNTQGE